jgi:hypothetical protein
MPADDHAAEIDVLRRRYPRWTIWFGLFTGHWWGLPPQDRDVGDFVEAETTMDLIARIEVIQHAVILDVPRQTPRQEPPRHDARENERRPSHFLRPEGAAPPPQGRIPVVAWPGSDAH